MLIKRTRKPPKIQPVQPAELQKTGSADAELFKYETRFCICPCKRPFKVKKESSRIYYRVEKCAYLYKKQQIREGKLPPDCYAKCDICGRWFPVWFVGGRKIPHRCSDEGCRSIDEQKEHSLDYVDKKSGWPYNYIPHYSYKAALIARQTYCMHGPDGKQGQCRDYGDCLIQPGKKRARIFEKFFTSKGSCHIQKK